MTMTISDLHQFFSPYIRAKYQTTSAGDTQETLFVSLEGLRLWAASQALTLRAAMEMRLRVGPHWVASCSPTVVEPVKLSLRTSGLAVISLPMRRALPVTTLKTPAGMPTRTASSAIASAL